MPDMLVKLYDMRPDPAPRDFLASRGVILRKPIGPEKGIVLDWIEAHFIDAWRSEADVAMSNWPMSCFIALRDNDLVGISCYDATALGFFGPIGVLERFRGQGIGKGLLLASLLDMKAKGYGYAIIGSAGPVDFYRRVVSATEIPDSEPGLWRGWLHRGDG